MSEQISLVESFEKQRAHLRAVALRMLGGASEAEDAVQETWLRVSRAGATGVDNLGGWMTTIVARVCLDMLRARRSKREEELGAHVPEAASGDDDAGDPERDRRLADSVGVALHVVLETLAPAERVAFVLHDLFELSFDEIGAIVGRSAAATRQLASRARRRVQGAPADQDADLREQRVVVDAFLAASRGGDLAALLTLLDPNVVVRADRAAVAASAARQAHGAPSLAPEIHGAELVASAFGGRARAAQSAVIDGCAGAVWAPGGRARAAFAFTVANGKILEIEVLLDPETVRSLDVTIVESAAPNA